jgi:hypothetical protein
MQGSAALRIYSLFPLAFLLRLNGWWSTFYFLANALLFIYKGALVCSRDERRRGGDSASVCAAVPAAADAPRARRPLRAHRSVHPSRAISLPPCSRCAANDFPYPNDGFASPLVWEVVFMLAFVPMEAARLWLATLGNMKEDAVPLGLSGLISVAVLTLHIYYVGLQTYVLMFDVILNSISFIFIGLEIVAGVVVMFFFQRFARF